MGPGAGADDPDVRVGGAAGRVFVIKHGNPGERKVSAPQREFLECPAAFGRPVRQANFDDEFVVGENGGQRTREELCGGYDARAG